MLVQLWNSAGCELDSRVVPANQTTAKCLSLMLATEWAYLSDGDSIKIVNNQ